MAGFGRNSRAGKRHGSSSSSFLSSFSYYATIVVFVAFCIFGVWMLSSSNVATPPQSTTTFTSRVSSSSSSTAKSGASRVIAFRNPPLDAEEDSQSSLLLQGGGDGDEGDKSVSKISSFGGSRVPDQEKEERSEGRQEEAEETEEKRSQEKKDEDEEGKKADLDGGTEEVKQLSEETHEKHQREHDEQLPAGDEGRDEGGETQQESQQQQQKHIKGDNQEEQIREEQTTQNVEQLPSSEGEDNQQEPQQQTGDDNQGNKQEDKSEVGDNNDQVEEKIQQVSDENQLQAKSEDDKQRDRVVKDSPNEEQQQQIATGGDEQQQPQSERQMEEEIRTDTKGEDNQQQSTDGETLQEVSNESQDKPWATQADHSDNEKERRKEEDLQSIEGGGGLEENSGISVEVEWKLCNVTAGPDYIPCLDNEKAIKKLHSFRHYEHRERHCPEESPTCLVPLPAGYKRSIQWPKSRDRIWYSNVPRTKLAEVKGHQNWVKVAGEYLTFPGGGTQFIHGALHYIDFIQQSVRDITWGKHNRVILDVGCGVASFGGYLFERDVLAMSFAPKDEHEAQVQFALERGIPAISAVMGSQRLPFPSNVFDTVHCARCRVPWHVEGGTLLLELNRVLRPGGYFVWSATPVYQKLTEDVEIWKAMKSLAASMCWELVAVKKDKLNSVGAAFFRKPTSNQCYDNRKRHNPPMCKQDDDRNAAWYILLKTCMHRVPEDGSERGSRWPKDWPLRLQEPPYWLNSSQVGIYGRPAPDDFTADYQHWKRVLAKSYLSGLHIDWGKVRNIMDMRAIYGGFAAALKDLKVWVMNVVNIDDPDTLPIIYERGLFGIYHDWCESFSTYPRTYDLLHADHLFSRIKKRCKIVSVIAEVDRLVRPGGKIIARDDPATMSEVERLLKSLHWVIRFTSSKDQEAIIFAEKSNWRPEKFVESS